jgi:hypothetical protein
MPSGKEADMTIGGSIALIILGAILAFAVSLEVAGIDIQVVGVILMIGGLIGLVFGLVYWRRGRVVTTSTAPTRTVQRTTQIDDEVL